MKSRSKDLLDRAIAAMVAAIEIYNKPGFPYRTESFAILAINGWELLLKAKWLADNRNRVSSLYVYETRENADGSKSKKKYVKRTDAGNPFTHSLSFKDALAAQITNDPNAPAVRLTDEHIGEKYPWDYQKLDKHYAKKVAAWRGNA